MNAKVIFKSGKTVIVDDVKEIRKQYPNGNTDTLKPEDCFVVSVPLIFIGKQILSVSSDSVEYVEFRN